MCDDCRKKLTMAPLPRSESEEVVKSSEEEVVESGEEDNASSEHEEVFYQQESLQPLNQCLTAIGETPIAKKKLQVKYRKQKLKKIRAVVNKRIVPEIQSSNGDDESEMIRQLKEKFEETNMRSEKVQILTVLPKSWSFKMSLGHQTTWRGRQKIL